MKDKLISTVRYPSRCRFTYICIEFLSALWIILLFVEHIFWRHANHLHPAVCATVESITMINKVFVIRTVHYPNGDREHKEIMINGNAILVQNRSGLTRNKDTLAVCENVENYVYKYLCSIKLFSLSLSHLISLQI